MNDFVYYLTFTYWTLSSVLAILGNGFIILVTSNLSKDKWRLRVDKVTVTFIFCLALMDFLYGITLLIMIINDIFLLQPEHGVNIFGFPAEINAPIMLINYGVLNIVLNRVNVMSWTANIVIILVITVHRLAVIYFPLHRITLYKAKVIGIVCCVVSAGYALYPLVMFRGLPSSACGDRKAFMVREVCAELDGDNVKFGELTGHQQAGICMYSLFYIFYILMILLNLLLLSKATNYAAAKHRSKQKPIITTLCISGLFILGWTFYMAWISIMVYLRTRIQHDVPINGPKYRTVLNWLEFWGYFLYTISTWGNPIIYTMVNRRFRKLVEKRGSKMVQTSLQNIQNLSRPLRVSIENTRKSLTREACAFSQMDTVSEVEGSNKSHKSSGRSHKSSTKSDNYKSISLLDDGATPV